MTVVLCVSPSSACPRPQGEAGAPAEASGLALPSRLGGLLGVFLSSVRRELYVWRALWRVPHAILYVGVRTTTKMIKKIRKLWFCPWGP